MSKGKTVDMLRKPQWYKMHALFDGPSKRVAELEGQDVLLRGVKYRASVTCGKCGHAIKANLLSVKGGKEDKLDLTPELALCVVPTAILESQGEALRHMLEANLRMPVLLLTDNVHLVRLKPVSGQVAKEIMEQAAEEDKKAAEQMEQLEQQGGKVVQLTGTDKGEESKE